MGLLDMFFTDEKKNEPVKPAPAPEVKKRTGKSKLQTIKEIDEVKEILLSDSLKISSDITHFEAYMKSTIAFSFCVSKCDGPLSRSESEVIEKIFISDKIKLAKSIIFEYNRLAKAPELPLKFIIKEYIAKVNKSNWRVYDIILKACVGNSPGEITQLENELIATWQKFKKANNV